MRDPRTLDPAPRAHLRLDASVQAEVLNLGRSGGGEATFLMVSHDLAIITHMCERLMVMQDEAVEITTSLSATA
jgi:peptide/nickel transport system ATP-binding protein